MEKDVQVVVPEHYNGEPIKVEMYTGTLPSPKQIDSKVKVSGSIYAPWEYVSKKFVTAYPDDTTPDQESILTYHLGANGGKPWIKFDEFAASAYDGAVINGELVPNPDLDPWQINTNSYFSNKQLQNLIRKNSFAFADVREAERLIKTLQNFQVSFETQIERTDDRAGNTKNSVENFIKVHKGAFDEEITLWLPLFKGTDKEHIHLSIEVEKQGNEVMLGFYSIDLERKRRELSEKIVGSEVDKFRKLFVCIEVL